jgi:hypothetical protein
MMTLEEMTTAAKNHFQDRNVTTDRSGRTGSDAAYELVFDSFGQAAGEGVRNSVVAARQLLFRIGSVFVDVEVGRETDSDHASLIGQMLDSSNPSRPPVGVPVVLLDRGRRVATTSSNDHGEFRLQFAVKNNLKLSVAFDRDRPVHLPITSPPGKGGAGPVKKCKPLGSVENRAIAQ